MTKCDKRLKILFLPTWYSSDLNTVSGLTIREHARAASLYDDIVVLYSYPDPSPKLYKLHQVSESTEYGIRTIRIKFRSYEEKQSPSPSAPNALIKALKRPLLLSRAAIRDLLYYYSILAAFRELVKGGWKPDIIHSHNVPASVPAILLGKLYGIPVVITERFSDLASHNLGYFQRMKTRFAMNRAYRILPVSNALKEAIETYGISNDFQVVPNVVNTDTFHPLHRGNQGGNRKRILLVANLTPIKGIPYLLQALAKIKEKRQDFVLDIVGDGAKRGEYEELTEELGLQDVIKFHGRKLKEEVAAFMRSSDFLVLPSLYETFGAVIIEALASGKPVVASDIGGIKDIITEDLGILTPPGDMHRLSQAIESMLDNHANYSPEELSEYAKAKYGYEPVGQALNAVYRKVKERM